MLKKRYTPFSTLIIFLHILLSACGDFNPLSQLITQNIFDVDDFSSKNRSSLPSLISNINLEAGSSDYITETVLKAYESNNHKPIWYTAQGRKSAMDNLLDDVGYIEATEGILMKDISESIQFINNYKSSKNIDTIVQNDFLMSYVYTILCHRILLGNVPPKFSKHWQIPNDSIQKFENPLMEIINATDSFNLWNHYRSIVPGYSAMMKEIEKWDNLKQDSQYCSIKNSINSQSDDSALQYVMNKELGINSDINDTSSTQPLSSIIKKYQYHYCLKETGRLDESTIKILKRSPDYYIDKLKLNMERIRWIPKDLGEEYIFVNIPLMELFYKKDNTEIFHANVIIGKNARPTPSIMSNMTDIVFNPPWGVPPTILNQEIGPGVAKNGGTYLQKRGLKAYDSRGRDVTNEVNGNNYKKYRIAQPPGAGNALGDIKFNMPNSEAIFIHDTPNKGHFKNAHRALSSGCIRTENPKALAELILKNKGYDMDKINSVISTRKTERVNLNRHIPVYILYITTHFNEADNSVIYLTDVYGKDKNMK